MSPDETIRRAVKILGAAACREDVEDALEEVRVWRDLSARRTKKGKTPAKRLAAALRRVDVAMRDDNIFPLLLTYLPHDKLLARLRPRQWGLVLTLPAGLAK